MKSSSEKNKRVYYTFGELILVVSCRVFENQSKFENYLEIEKIHYCAYIRYKKGLLEYKINPKNCLNNL